MFLTDPDKIQILYKKIRFNMIKFLEISFFFWICHYIFFIISLSDFLFYFSAKSNVSTFLKENQGWFLKFI